jgi:hypothetical protein
MPNSTFTNLEKAPEEREAKMIRKYRIDFEFADGVLVPGYTSQDQRYNTMTREAFTAVDAKTQAEIEIKTLSRQYNRFDFSPESWRIIRISPMEDCAESSDAVPSA